MAALRSSLEDFFRVHDPARAASVPALLAALPAGGAAALTAALEREYAAPRFFELGAFDFSGRAFDARAALYDPHVVPPVPCAVPLDNVHKAGILLPPAAAAAAAASAAAAAATGRLHGAGAEARDARRGTLLDWLAAELPREGPLGALRAWREAGARVRALLRGGREASGRLRGVDRDFNLLLLDAAGDLIIAPGAEVLALHAHDGAQ